jgi:transcriptional regulator NrdR family protein
MSSHTRCPNCTSDDLLVVDLTPKDALMRFTTCRHCEHRWWEDVDTSVDVALGQVLGELSAR